MTGNVVAREQIDVVRKVKNVYLSWSEGCARFSVVFKFKLETEDSEG